MEKNDKLKISRNELKIALQKGEFLVYMQPQIDMVTFRLHGAEALSRWMHPTEGLLAPHAFIPYFEENGLIAELDLHVFEEVCRIKAAWKKEGKKYSDIVISANMSRVHLHNPDFPKILSSIADKYGINHDELEIEITETVFVADTDILIKSIANIKEEGFLIALDDFGSGFSGLNLLKDITVDTIKIDKSFLHGSGSTELGKIIIKNIIALCLDLKVTVITEGIEAEAQIQYVKKCGCAIAQGFFYSTPISLAEFQDFADEYLKKVLANYTFHFDGDLYSADGNYDAMTVGRGFEYLDGLSDDTESLYFPGGPVAINVVFIPKELLVNDSYTVALWVNPEKIMEWTSVFYVRYAMGFVSIAPCADTGLLTFRIWNSSGMNGWYDIESEKLKENEWTHLVLSFNAKTNIASAFVNGELIGSLENVPTNRYVEEIIIGGDNFKDSFIGRISDLVIYNETKDADFIKELYESYLK